MKQVLLSIAATVIARFPHLFGTSTLGFGKVSMWYETNGVFRYSPGTHVQASESAFGYGIRAQGVIVEVLQMERHGSCIDTYIVDVTRDSCGDYLKPNYVDPTATRITERQIHFKWNIENQWNYSEMLYSRLMRLLRHMLSKHKRNHFHQTGKEFQQVD